MFEGLFDEQPKNVRTKPQTNNAFEGLFDSKEKETQPKTQLNIQGLSKPKISTLPEFLGSGSYYGTMADRPPTTPHTTYGGFPTKKGYERQDIIPAFAGGVNVDPKNIRYDPSGNWWDKLTDKPVQELPHERRQLYYGESRLVEENRLYKKYKNKEISRADVFTSLKRWEFEQELKPSFLEKKKQELEDTGTAIKIPIQFAFNSFFNLGIAFNEKVIKPVQRAVLPKKAEYALGITERPSLKFEVGEGLEDKFPTPKQVLSYGLGPVKPELLTNAEKIMAEITVKKQPEVAVSTGLAKEFYNDLRLAKDVFVESKDKFSYIDTLGTNLIATTINASTGAKGATVNKKGFGQYFIDSADKKLKDLRKKDPFSADTIDSLAFSLSAQGSALLAGAGTQITTKNPIASMSVASGISGIMAYRMAEYQIMQQYLELKDDESKSSTGKGITQEEEDRLKKEFSRKAKEFGLWEAVPEALSGGLGFGLLSGAFKKMLGTKVSENLLLKLGVFYSGELATETVTQMGQTRIMAQTGFPNVEDINWTSKTDWLTSLKDVAPQTFLLTTILGGGASVITKTQVARQEIKDEALLNKVVEKIEETEKLTEEEQINKVKERDATLNFAKSRKKELNIKAKNNILSASEVKERDLLNENFDDENIILSKNEPNILNAYKIEKPKPQATIEDIRKTYQATPTKVSEAVKETEVVADTLRGTKGLSAEDIVKKYPDINLKRDVPAKDIYGNKVVIPEGEALTPYELKGNKILLQDGETYIVSKNQFQNIKGQSVAGEAPILKQPSGKKFEPKPIKVEEKPVIKKVPREQLPVKPLDEKGKIKVSRLEARIKESLGNLNQDAIDDLGLATYNELNKIENIKKASEYVIENETEAMDVLLGKQQAPKGILRNSIFIAMQNKATQDVNKALALKLASLESTRFGQEISILTEIDEYSPVKAVSKLVKIHEKAVQKRTGKKPSETKKQNIKSIKDKIKQPTKNDWIAFIDEIKC